MRIKPSALFDFAPRHVCRATHSFPLSAPHQGCSPAFLFFLNRKLTIKPPSLQRSAISILISFRLELFPREPNGSDCVYCIDMFSLRSHTQVRRKKKRRIFFFCPASKKNEDTLPVDTADLSEAFCIIVPLYFQTDFEKDVDIACRSGKERPCLKLGFSFCSVLQK